MRKPKDCLPRAPADLVEVDTLDMRPLPGVVFKHFTARDMNSRCDVLEVHRKATATTVAGFLDTLQARTQFPIRAAQVERRVGVPRRLRGRVPTPRSAPVRAPAALAQAQRRGRARPAHSHRGVL